MILNDPALCRKQDLEISFTVGGDTLTALNNMTWENWCGSSYNTVGMYTREYTAQNVAYSLVCPDDAHCVADDQGYVDSGDVIVPGGTYSLVQFPTN